MPVRRLLFYCQYVFGMGHLVRSLEVVRALARDFEVTFVAGGGPVEGMPLPPGVRLVRLPALESPHGFQGLRPCDPGAGLEATRSGRQRQLLALFDEFDPDALVIELFPFGRKQFSFELLPLLETARRRGCLVACSLRDILVRKQDPEAHEQRVCDIANAYFNLVLIHGDPALVTLDETFARARALTCELRYTGYVVRTVPALRVASPGGPPAIVASIGGGRSLEGFHLLETLLGAAALLRGRLPHEFRVFAGPFMPADSFARLQQAAQGLPHLQLQKFTPDLISQLSTASLSISLGGYNTTMDVLRTGVRSLILPADDSGDQEQALRAAKLQHLGAIGLLDPASLTVSRLAAHIVDALRKPPRAVPLNLNGADTSRAILSWLCPARGSARPSSLHLARVQAGPGAARGLA